MVYASRAIACLASTLIAFGFFAHALYAQELHQENRGVFRAEVTEIKKTESRIIPGTQTPTTIQTLEARILEGEQKGRIITVENDFLTLEEGDRFFLNYLVTIDNEGIYIVGEADRTQALYFFVGLFALAVILFGGLKGVRSLLSLAISFGILFYFLLPALLSGVSPLLASTGYSILILTVAIFLTHGFKRVSLSALLGTILTIGFTTLLASLAVKATRLTGFSDDASTYLNLGTRGILDFQGLLLGAIIIGVLGVLDDIAITQAVTVHELRRAAPDLSKYELFMRAYRMGREHIAALINTLALAYTSVALPLLLLFMGAEAPFTQLINREIFATEIIRTIVGSVGIILAVPITTIFAVAFLPQDTVLTK